MKSTFFKSMLLPIATVVLGVGGAFTTTSMSSTKTLADQIGFYELDENRPCVQSSMCQTVDNGQICSAIVSGTNHILKGKTTPNALTCPVTLWRKP